MIWAILYAITSLGMAAWAETRQREYGVLWLLAFCTGVAVWWPVCLVGDVWYWIRNRPSDS